MLYLYVEWFNMSTIYSYNIANYGVYKISNFSKDKLHLAFKSCLTLSIIWGRELVFTENHNSKQSSTNRNPKESSPVTLQAAILNLPYQRTSRSVSETHGPALPKFKKLSSWRFHSGCRISIFSRVLPCNGDDGY